MLTNRLLTLVNKIAMEIEELERGQSRAGNKKDSVNHIGTPCASSPEKRTVILIRKYVWAGR